MDQPSTVHHADAIGDGHCLLLVVRNDDKGEAELFLQLHQFELRFAAQLLVECGEQLVEKKNARPFHQRAGKCHALTLTARQRVRLALGKAFELDQRQHLGNAYRDF